MGKYSWSDKEIERREHRRPKPQPKKLKIKPASTKRAKQNKEYQVVRIQYLIDHPLCEAMVKCKGNRATEIHHAQGRIADLLTDTNNFLSVCRSCHEFIENNPNEAKEMGLSVNRIK